MSVLWNNYDGCEIGHIIHPTWEKLSWRNAMLSKSTNVQYHRLAVGRGNTRIWYDRIGISVGKTCRFCNATDETLKHIFLTCPNLQIETSLRSQCAKFNLEIFFLNVDYKSL